MFYNRVYQLLIGWGTVGVIYHLTGYWQRDGYLLAPTIIDEWLTFQPAAIWPYLSFFLIIPIAYFNCPIERLKWLRYSMQLTALLCGSVYAMWPTTMVYPAFSNDSLSGQLLTYLMSIDSSQNCLPSLHAALTGLAVFALLVRGQPYKNGLIILWGMIILLSIIQLRRHLFVDLVSGLAVAGLAGTIIKYRLQASIICLKEKGNV